MKKILIPLMAAASAAFGANDSPVETGSMCEVGAVVRGDSVVFRVETDMPALQMPMLMQGLKMKITAPEALADTLMVEFPSAGMVKDLLRHHPNEVKPTFNGSDSVACMVRPDLQPLAAALNQSRLRVCGRSSSETDSYSIAVDRERQSVVFEASLPLDILPVVGPEVLVILSSSPEGLEERLEFSGRRLSKENRRNPHGFGQGYVGDDKADKRVDMTFRVEIGKAK